MTFSLKNYLLLSAVGATALCSCSNDDFDDFGTDAKGRMVEMTVTLAKGDVDEDNANGSRTTLVENGGDLTCLWEENDRVLIANADGTPAGVLALSDGAGEAIATFTGQVDANKINTSSSKTYVYVHYFGTEVDPETVTTTYRHDFSTQPGTQKSLSDYDYFRNTVGITLEGDVLTTKNTAKLSRVTAFGRFHLNFSDGAILTPDAQVTVTGSFLHTVGNFGLKDQCTFDTPTTNTITTAIDPANGDIWLTILPASAPKTTSLTFTVTEGETTYTGTLAERQWKANEYVRATLADGTFAGIPVEMTPTTGGDDNDETNEYGEPLNNPLAKWAKGNLYRVDGLTNGILEDETDNGALYQWGRNYGYMDTKGIYEGSDVNPGEDFTNYLDAMGSVHHDIDNYQSWNDYYVYNPTNDNVVSGVGAYLNKGWFWQAGPLKYSSADDIKAHPDKYFIDGNPAGNTEDYWISSFGNGGNTWDERAIACGYEKTNPCPEEWTIPTEEDFREILPSTNLEQSNSLPGILQNKAEIRVDRNSNRYVIRWLSQPGYLEIQSVLVNDSFSQSDITSEFWDRSKNANQLVIRKFPYTGFIDNVVGCDIYVEVAYGGGYYALPYHRNKAINSGVWMVNLGFDNVSYPTQNYLKILPGDNYGNSIGCYWIKDGKKAMKFSNKQSFESTSYLLIENGNPVMGYAIRPVRDYSK